jgi:GTP-binding protein
MKFVDRVTVYLKGGDGGNGCLSFRKARFRPKGGPDGGDGGRGGDVFLYSDPQMASLAHLLSQPRLVAENGKQGGSNDQTGRNGKDLIVRVPVGTRVVDPQTGQVLEDLIEGGKRYLAAKGGRGGRGNAQFATATDRTPRRAEKGERGERRHLRLEFRLFADVALVGLANAGKSTLISALTAAKPRIAPYPYTTTSPHLGVVRDDLSGDIVVADTPALVEDAHRGCGLGNRFLRHIERTRLIVYVLDLTSLPDRSPLEDYRVLQRELAFFDPSLEAKPGLVAINKLDLSHCIETAQEIQRAFAKRGIAAFLISALTGEGIPAMIAEVAHRLRELRPVNCQRGVL